MHYDDDVMFCYREKEQKRLAMLKRKTTYVAGQWNANTVLMGGLGKAPENEDSQCKRYSTHNHP